MRILVLFISLLTFNAIALGETNILDSGKEWLALSNECPADIMRSVSTSIHSIPGYCENRVEECLKACEKNDAEACYNIATHLQGADERYQEISEALFFRSCQLGVVSGCTNRAAGLQKMMGDEALDCSIRTYNKACELKDAWSCTMLGFHLAIGKGIDKDLHAALEAFKGSCINGPSDPACQRAKTFSDQIEAVLESEN